MGNEMINVAVVMIWVVLGIWFAIAAWADKYDIRNAAWVAR